MIFNHSRQFAQDYAGKNSTPKSAPSPTWTLTIVYIISTQIVDVII